MIERRIAQLRDALEGMGHIYDLDDIRALIEAGTMQSFVDQDDSWAVTQIIDYPRKRVLDVFLVVGDLAALPVLREQVETFAQAHGCNMVRAFGRTGWLREAPKYGWKSGYRIFSKDLK